jgi:hypothetical protein
MAKRDERLNALKVGSACQASWAEMRGDDHRRFCDTCQKNVFDFAQMTPRDIHAHLEASRGQLCGRLTRDGGRLRVLPPNEPAVPWTPRKARRVSPFAATLVSAWIGMGSAAAQPAAPVSPAADSPREGEGTGAQQRSQPGATLRGRVHAKEVALQGVEIVARHVLDGSEQVTVTDAAGGFRFQNLPAGVYDLLATYEGFAIERPQNLLVEVGRERFVDLVAEAVETDTYTTSGAIAWTAPSLRQLVAEADLVVSATVGRSEILELYGDILQVATELQIGEVAKGDFAGRTLSYRHAEYLEAPHQAPPLGPEPGTKVLAFLVARLESAPRAVPLYDLAGYSSGILQLDPAAHAFYLERVQALAPLKRGRWPHRGRDPFALTEWLVASAESPYLRAEATSELRDAFSDLRAVVNQEGSSEEAVVAELRRALISARGAPTDDRKVFLAAAMSAEQKSRLTAALEATLMLDRDDRDFFYLVRRWNEEAATDWLVGRLRQVEPSPDDAMSLLWWLRDYARNLDSEAASALAAEAIEQEEALDHGLAPGDEGYSEAAATLAAQERRQKLADIDRAFMRKLADVLAMRSVSAGENR